MFKPLLPWGLLSLLLFPALLFSPATVHGAEPPEKPSYEHDIRPILKTYCFDCHGGQELKAGLDLRLRRLIVKGGEGGPAIVPGDVDGSELVHRIRDKEMPPGEKKLSDEQVALIAKWVAAGAPTLRDEPETVSPITPEERAHWAYQPITRPEVPQARPEERVRTAIDALLLPQMRAKGLAFSPDADRLTMIRRATFDLLGLPPSQAEIDRFLADTSPDAYEQLLDRLLASPQYGERWGRHWLDIAGYADSDGYTNADVVRPYAYKYRDYVIRSLNADKPVDRFIVEQLAGDELVPPPYKNLSPEQIDLLVATGFLRMAADGTLGGNVDQDLARNQVVIDTIKIVSSSLLSMSVACAQCHDHRYDPIPQADYYRMRAVFEPALDWKHWRNPRQRLVSLYTDADRAKAAEVEKQVAKVAAEKKEKQQQYMTAALEKNLLKFPEEQRGTLRDAYNAPADKKTPEQKKLLDENPSIKITPGVLYQYDPEAAKDLKTYDAKIADIRKAKPVEDFISILNEVPKQVPQTFMFYRGDYRQPKEAIQPGGLSVVMPPGKPFNIPADDTELPSTGRRLAFARHLTSGTHPLVGRSLANRIWLGHFGRGIVDTPADFGILGHKPTHPELLDWLASEFVQQGWSLKKMHKLLMTSTVYRQSSRRDPAKDAIDAENTTYWRMPLRRLEAEAIRDRVLSVSGQLDLTLFGPPVPVVEDFVGQVVVEKEVPRRSIYIQVRRSKPLSMLAAFDAPVMETNCDRRVNSTAAPQSLMLMNSEFSLKQAELFAKKVRGEVPAGYAADLIAKVGSRAPQLGTSAWQYGYGQFDSGTQRTGSFQPLPHWTGSNWQGGEKRPDPKLDWAILNPTGGHPGHNPGLAVIRRWVAPKDGFVAVTGKLAHPAEAGDGVRGRLVSSRGGLLGEWLVHKSDAVTNIPRVEVHAGDTLDFITDCHDNTNADSFQWTAELQMTDAGNNPVDRWNSSTEFRGPPGPPIMAQVAYAWNRAFCRSITEEELVLSAGFLDRQWKYLQSTGDKSDLEQTIMTNLCQQLLSANEFLYVD